MLRGVLPLLSGKYKIVSRFSFYCDFECVHREAKIPSYKMTGDFSEVVEMAGIEPASIRCSFLFLQGLACLYRSKAEFGV